MAIQTKAAKKFHLLKRVEESQRKTTNKDNRHGDVSHKNTIKKAHNKHLLV